jgi:hypothetical protein
MYIMHTVMDVCFFTLRILLYNDKEGHLFVSKKIIFNG